MKQKARLYKSLSTVKLSEQLEFIEYKIYKREKFISELSYHMGHGELKIYGMI